MTSSAPTLFRHLNVEGRWPGFVLDGLTVEDGALMLAAAPGDARAVGPPLAAPRPGLEPWPAGIAVTPDGVLFVADPAGDRIVRIDGCDETGEAFACASGPGTEPGRVRRPHGVAIGPGGVLYVADTGNHRIQVFDARTGQLRDVWGQPDPYAEPAPGAEPGRFEDPRLVCVDSAGSVYVLDHGNRRVQKLDRSGHPDPSFWKRVLAGGAPPAEPVWTSCERVGGEDRLFVVDRDAAGEDRLLVLLPDGSADEATAAAWAGVLPERIGALALGGDVLYVADALGGRVLALAADGTVGPARGFEGTVAGLAWDPCGTVLVHPGAGAPVVGLRPRAARVRQGRFRVGPLEPPEDSSWWRVRVTASPILPDTHVQIFTYASSSAAGPAAPPVADASATEPTPPDRWRAAPRDQLDFLVLHEPARFLWIEGVITGDEAQSPAVHQIRLHERDETWLRFLPEAWRREPDSRVFLERALSLFESFFEEERDAIDSLPRLFDAQAAPDGSDPPTWLRWLASWVALDPPEGWDEATRRRAIASAFERHGRRGTIDGLRELLELWTGTPVHVEEPGRFGGLWLLGGDRARLGLDTMLVPAEPQGAVVGTTATLERSHLLEDQDYGAPLLEDLANRFCVAVYEAETRSREAETALVRLIEREKPAHTTYHLCVLGARARVGFQARIGVDTIVAEGPAEARLDPDAPLGVGWRLAGREEPVRVGETARLDGHVRLT